MRHTIILLIGLLLCPSIALAADLTVISGGAIRPGLTTATAAFEAKTGHRVQLVFNSSPQIKERLASGEAFDVVIAPPGVMAGFMKAGKVESRGVEVGRVGAGIAVRQGAPVPRVTTANEVKQAIIDADSIVFNRSSSGQHIEKLMKEMGVWPEVEAKTTRYMRADDVMEHLIRGQGNELGFGPMTKILAFKEKGLVLAGPLPQEIQKLRAYNAAAMKISGHKNVARAYIAFLVGREGKAHFVAAGIE